MKKTSISDKYSDLYPILKVHFKGRLNLARAKFVTMFIIALCKVQTVNYSKLANAFESEALAESSLRKIQRFMANFSLDANLIAKLIFSLLPDKQGLTISIDRTNWKFGKLNINIFMLGIVYKGVAFPLLFSMLPKRGNSNSNERILLINRYINLFGKETIDCIVADREFVGKDWIDYLNYNEGCSLILSPFYNSAFTNFVIINPHLFASKVALRNIRASKFSLYQKDDGHLNLRLIIRLIPDSIMPLPQRKP